ncbi:carbohydrate kinase family protein [Streptomyces albipurpureus]|uniref:PfkB family carbohydrate kinase n=1 Tax=Streptomyces albipurpureus TaxID=2897419 RepID=A0ABT0US90_9ACTN|nr:PfkB family carbohydrate kinase [Streptomyces sp. CWNU-1]MCM2390834.1 PfkB family carbohydrate kinase [Streptomyces sp. CWNU-1]
MSSGGTDEKGGTAVDEVPSHRTGGRQDPRAALSVGSPEPSALLVIGEVVTDVLARHSTDLVRGTDTAARISILPGGAGANVACWAAYCGVADVRLLGRVGPDETGWHESVLRSAGVRPLLIRDAEAPTATVIVLIDATAEGTLLSDSGAALRIGPEDWSPSLLDGVGHLHLSGYLYFSDTGRRLARVATQSARSRGISVSVDPASAGFIEAVGVDRLLNAYGDVDVLIPNADEACLLTGLPDPTDATLALSGLVPLAVVTLGAKGALVAGSGQLIASVPPHTARSLDSTGAGDAFTGAFLAARQSGADAARAAAAGCRAGAQAVTVVGARPPRKAPAASPRQPR